MAILMHELAAPASKESNCDETLRSITKFDFNLIRLQIGCCNELRLNYVLFNELEWALAYKAVKTKRTHTNLTPKPTSLKVRFSCGGIVRCEKRDGAQFASCFHREHSHVTNVGNLHIIKRCWPVYTCVPLCSLYLRVVTSVFMTSMRRWYIAMRCTAALGNKRVSERLLYHNTTGPIYGHIGYVFMG